MTAPPKNLHILGPPCICGKRFSFINEGDALEFARLSKGKKYSHAHKCNSGTGNWHLTTHGSGKLKNIERELHKEMANNPKTIRQRITDYMWDSYKRNKTVKFSSSMVIFALQQDKPETRKPQIAQELSKAKKDGIIVSLKEPVPDQRGAVYFTLSRILEAETEPNSVTETVKPEVPAQTKPVPVNPFDTVNKKLTEIKDALGNSEITLDEEDFNKLAGKLEEKLEVKFKALFNAIQEQARGIDKVEANTEQLKTAHVTVDGDKLADVINARLQNLKLDDSFIYRVREEISDPTAEVVKNQQILRNVMEGLKDIISDLPTPQEVSNSSDYRVGIKDGIRISLEMGLKLDD